MAGQLRSIHQDNSVASLHASPSTVTAVHCQRVNVLRRVLVRMYASAWRVQRLEADKSPDFDASQRNVQWL
jgi:hypothetical protein